MQVVRAVRESLDEPFLTLVGDAVVVRIRELPDAGGSGYIDRALVPQNSFGEHHPVREHGALVVAPVTIQVREAQDAVRTLFQLLADVVVRARGFGDIQTPLIVGVHDHGPLDERRAGRQFDLEAFRNRDVAGDAGIDPAAAAKPYEGCDSGDESSRLRLPVKDPAI